MNVEQALKQLRVDMDESVYVLLKLHPRAVTLAAGILAETADPFLGLIVDQHEVTLVLDAELVTEFEPRLRDYVVSEARFRLLTLDVVLAHDVVGFMAVVARALADEGISVMPYAAYSRDHLLVPEDQAQVAVEVIQSLESAK